MGDLMVELKELRLHGMACAWEELASQGDAATASSKWLLEHLLQQEHVDRAVRSVNHQMNMAKLPMHRDLAGFDFSQRRRPLGICPDWSSPIPRRMSCSSAGLEQARPIWPPPWQCPGSRRITNACASTPRSDRRKFDYFYRVVRPPAIVSHNRPAGGSQLVTSISGPR